MHGPGNTTRVVMVQSVHECCLSFTKIVAKRTGKWNHLFKMVEKAGAGNEFIVKRDSDPAWLNFARGANWSDEAFPGGSRRVFLQVKNHHIGAGNDHMVGVVADVLIFLL